MSSLYGALTSSLDGVLTSFVRGIYDELTLTSSHEKRFPTPSPYPLSVSELVQAQGCPVVRLGHVRIGRLAEQGQFRAWPRAR